MAFAPARKVQIDGKRWVAVPVAARFTAGPILLWAAFAIVHLLLGALALTAPGLPMGDVSIVYKGWAQLAVAENLYVGIDAESVYPILALLPIITAAVLGFSAYDVTWLGMVVALNAVAFGMLVIRARTRPGARAAAWWWLAFLALLGPIAVGRLDSITVPIAIVALLWLGTRPRLAAVLLAAATWIKVWPAAILAAVFIASKARWQLFASAAVTSAVIVAAALMLGSGMNVFSFITGQTDRGLQLEAPVSGIWLWRSVFQDPTSFLYYDNELLTFQMAGPGVDIASAVMTPLLVVAVMAVIAVGMRGLRHGLEFERLLPPLVLALVATLIAFNKVGSPQFVTWLAAPVILGLVMQGKAFRVPAIMVAVIAGLTQVFYPYLYGYLLGVYAPMVAVLTVRNLLYFVLLGWAVHALWAATQHATREQTTREQTTREHREVE